MQIKIIMRYHLTLVRMAIIKKSTNNKSWREYGGKGTLLHCWQGWKLVQPLLRIVWRFLKELETDLSCDPAISLLNIHPEKTIIRKDTCTSMFIAVLFTIARTWKQPKCVSTESQIKKIRHIERSSISLIIREMKIKTTIRYHLTLVRMAIIKKSANNKFQRVSGEERNPPTLLVGK